MHSVTIIHPNVWLLSCLVGVLIAVGSAAWALLRWRLSAGLRAGVIGGLLLACVPQVTLPLILAFLMVGLTRRLWSVTRR